MRNPYLWLGIAGLVGYYFYSKSASSSNTTSTKQVPAPSVMDTVITGLNNNGIPTGPLQVNPTTGQIMMGA